MVRLVRDESGKVQVIHTHRPATTARRPAAPPAPPQPKPQPRSSKPQTQSRAQAQTQTKAQVQTQARSSRLQPRPQSKPQPQAQSARPIPQARLAPQLQHQPQPASTPPAPNPTSTSLPKKPAPLQLPSSTWSPAPLSASSAAHTPLRLDEHERQLMRVTVEAVKLSKYTDIVDQVGGNRRVATQVRQLHALLVGLVVIQHDIPEGRAIMKRDVPLSQHAPFLQTCFETVRRYKMLHPERLRHEYPKVMYVLQDAQQPDVVEALGLTLVTPVRTVASVAGSDTILRHAHVNAATLPGTRPADAAAKASAVARILADVVTPEMNVDMVHRILLSLEDARHLDLQQGWPIRRVRELLDAVANAGSAAALGVTAGKDGARLSHSSAVHAAYVRQSLEVWRDVTAAMHELWTAADADLLCPDRPYVLRNTGQGLQRVQPAPTVHKQVSKIVERVARASGWVGLRAIHLGDDMVPNALLFLDKYLQIGSILRPVLRVLDSLAIAAAQPASPLAVMANHLYGSLAAAQTALAVHFLNHAFDGSGGDTAAEAGSCVDGRLTSAWNWCHGVARQRYYPLLQLTDVTSFDAE